MLFHTLDVFLKRCGRAVIHRRARKILCAGRGHGIEEDVVIIAVVCTVNDGCTLDIGGMCVMIRCGALDNVIAIDTAAEQIMHVCTALSGVQKAIFRAENIIGNDMRTMSYLKPKVLEVVVIHVVIQVNALRLPVKPRAHAAMVDIVMMDLCIDRRMKLDACDLIAEIFVFRADIVNFVVVDLAERAAEMSDDAVLSAIVNHIVTHDMRADGLTAPAHALCLENDLELGLIAGLSVITARFVIACGKLLAKAHGTATRIVNDIVFDDINSITEFLNLKIEHVVSLSPISKNICNVPSSFIRSSNDKLYT